MSTASFHSSFFTFGLFLIGLFFHSRLTFRSLIKVMAKPELKTEEGYNADIVRTYISRDICPHNVRTITSFGFQLRSRKYKSFSIGSEIPDMLFVLLLYRAFHSTCPPWGRAGRARLPSSPSRHCLSPGSPWPSRLTPAWSRSTSTVR